MEKAREIVGILWFHKEKVFLVVLLVVLGAQIWRSVKKKDAPIENTVALVRPTGPDVPFQDVSDQIKDRISEKFDEVVPPMLPPDPLPSVPSAKLTENNPFYPWAQIEDTGSKERPNIVVKRIRKGKDGGVVALLNINGERTPYLGEGAETGGFRIDEIDIENNTVKVFSTSLKKTFTYTTR